jgi:hypothetical protein
MVARLDRAFDRDKYVTTIETVADMVAAAASRSEVGVNDDSRSTLGRPRAGSDATIRGGSRHRDLG